MPTILRSSWYALHVVTGQEIEVCAALGKIPGISATSPMQERMHRRLGRWETRYEQVFPGYVFVQCILSKQRYHAICAVHGVIRLLGVSPKGELPEPIPYGDMWWLRDMSDVVVGASKAVRRPNGGYDITDGILTKYRDYITRINARQHYADVTLPIGGTIHRIRFAVDVINPDTAAAE